MVDTASGAIGQPGLAGHDTFALGTDLTRSTRAAAAATVGEVGLGVHTGAAAVGLTGNAGDLTLAVGANFA